MIYMRVLIIIPLPPTPIEIAAIGNWSLYNLHLAINYSNKKGNYGRFSFN